MSKIIFLIILAGLAVVAVAAININNVDASQQLDFIQVSVLAKTQADYGVDEQVITIPAVSVELIEDAAQDFQTQSSIRIITYTALPTKEPKPDGEEQDGSDSIEDTKHDNGQGNGNIGGNGNQGNNGNGGSPQNGGNGNGNQNQNGNGNGKEKEKEDKPKKSK